MPIENAMYYLGMNTAKPPFDNLKARQAVIDEQKIIAGEDEVLFELMLDRVMHTRLENWGTPAERPVHRKWRAGI